MLNQRSSANKKLALFLAFIFCIIAFSGCSQNPAPPTKQNDSVTFTDSLGRTVTVQKKPKRVAALIGSFADVWVLSGGTLCAAPKDAWDDFGLELKDAINIGGAHSPSLEALLSANPQLVLASSSTASNVELKESLENAGIVVAYFDVDSFDDYLGMLNICTNITGQKDLYQKNGLDVQARINAIKENTKKAKLPQNKKQVLLLRASSGSVKAKGSDGTILGEMLRDLGCTNIADSDKTLLENLSVESVIQQNPYHIFVVTMGDDTQKATESLRSVITDNPAWNSLDAIKENRLHIMDKKLFNIKPNAKWAQSYEKLSDILLEN